MILTFSRVATRRYRIEVERPPLPAVSFLGPGYDPLIPHDLMHLVVEAQLNIRNGIFGQMSAGGGARSYNMFPGATDQAAGRARRRIEKRSTRMARSGRPDTAWSERATYLCWYEWLARSQDPQLRRKAQEMAEQARSGRGTAPANEIRALTKDKLREICGHLDALSSHWSKLGIGESMTVRWPDLAINAGVASGVASESCASSSLGSQRR